MQSESKLGLIYRKVYEKVCGAHPNLTPWHFQWLSSYFLNGSLKRHKSLLTGAVLDIGCGNRPYLGYLTRPFTYTGADFKDGPLVDLEFSMDDAWPIGDAEFDTILMTQVLEYSNNPCHVASEIFRVLRPGGCAFISLPFILNEHGKHDIIRLSSRSTDSIFKQFSPICIQKQGAIFSTITILLLNWVETSLNSSRATRFIKPALLPIWLLVCLIANLTAVAANHLDRTGFYYSNLFIIIKKPDQPTYTNETA